VVQTTAGDVAQGGEVLVVDPATLVLGRRVVLRHSQRADTSVSARGVPNYLGAPAIAPDGGSAWVPSKQDNIQRGRLRDGRDLDFQSTIRAISSRIDLGSESEDHPARVDHDDAGVASAAVHHPLGVYLFVALEPSRELAVVDAAGARELFRVDTGRAPQAVVVSADGAALYVHNALDRTVGVYDLGPLTRGQQALPLLVTLATVDVERLAPAILRGKQLFHDARDGRLARDRYLSCAGCHNDGGQDGRTWDLTGLGEGLRNTIDLRGRGGSQGRLHWSANFDEVQDFEAQLRSLAQGSGLMTEADLAAGSRRHALGDPKAGLSADLDALAAYVQSLVSFAPSPYRDQAGGLTAAAAAGRVVFGARCLPCHGQDAFTDSPGLVVHDVGTLKPGSGQASGGPLLGIDTPTLRDVWATAPYLHDGSAPTIAAAISAHSGLGPLSPEALANVAAFVQQIGGEEPAVSPPPPPAGGLTGQYFANATLSGAPAMTRVEPLSFNWGTTAPDPLLPADAFSARWTGQLIAPDTGAYAFQTVSDEGVRLWVDGTLLIDSFYGHRATTDTTASLALAAGQAYDVKIEYFEGTGPAVIAWSWQRPGTTAFAAIPAAQLQPATGPGGLVGQYFANPTLTGPPVATHVEPVNFDWAFGPPAAGLASDNFSVRWTGAVTARATGGHVFETVSDNGVRLWVGGQLLIDRWAAHGTRTDTSVPVPRAIVRLRWRPPGAAAAVPIPRSDLDGP
jgi:DNA-binding beta-propeller fold protein YncE/mono/diheme cytochrome c family protein